MSPAQIGSGPARQRGTVLVVGLIMLLLITVVLTGAYLLSSTNTRAVGNAQFRAEARAAANEVIETAVVSKDFWTFATDITDTVDIDNDGSTDFNVTVRKPVCISSQPQSTGASQPSSTSLGASFNTSTAASYLTEWDIQAIATDAHGSGARVEIHEGLRAQLDSTQIVACP